VSTESQFPQGWIDDPAAVDQVVSQLSHPILGDDLPHLADSGKDKTVLLHKAVERIFDTYPIGYQQIGDCVSFGCGYAVLALMCVEIVIGGEQEDVPAIVATEPIYAGSRVEVGGGRLGYGDGSIGAWAAKWVTEWGILLRQKYGAIDLTEYSGRRAKDWGGPRAGCPDELEPIAREHPVREVTKVTSYEEARDAIANGYPVSVASMQGFASRRDDAGFARASGRWAHQMYFVACDDVSRPGLLCVNSWGRNWISGPKRHGQPDGSFWVDADVADRMLGAGDSFAYASCEGFPRRKIDYMLI